MRKLMLISLSVAVALTLGGTALAFHNGGVAHCNGCHTMHNSQNGQPIDPNHPNGNLYLLNMETPSDVCLSCHSQTGTSSNGRYVMSLDPLNPQSEQGAGDFIFLTEDNLNDGYGGQLPQNFIPGYKGGHSIVAPSKNLAADPVLLTAPGGNFNSSMLGCSSCHDPHGNTSFRLLNGVGPVQAGVYTFTNPAPTASGITLSTAETNANHSAYKSGMSEWCANCHAAFHNSTHNLHPSGSSLSDGEAVRYGIYNGTLDQSGGNPATSYLALVPFEDPAMTTTTTSGPTANSKVMCLSCHRAHATTGPDIGRWDFNITTWVEEGVNSHSWVIPNPYPGSGNSQRSLCNKCHNKDAGDALTP
jgi:hypothetical protein